MKLPIIQQIDEAMIRNRNPLEGFRNHYGVSQIGKSCKRASWYDFHWMTLKEYQARILRIFNRGHREESNFIQLLESAGYNVLEVDPATGEQFRFSDQECPVIGGSVDGILEGLTEDGTFVGLELKTMKASKFRELTKKECYSAQPVHFSQMQGYMGLSQSTKWPMNAFLYLVVNKDDDSLYSELIPFDESHHQFNLDSARDVVRSNVPPDRISSTEDWFECNWCEHKKMCHRGEAPNHQNCRSCTHSRPELASANVWKCHRFDLQLERAEQIIGCNFYSARGE
ncbi:MAG: hypothetical protein CL524_11685 [Aequorivita sp.]|nr:hypothetical protein [Aequorivita sp.]